MLEHGRSVRLHLVSEVDEVEEVLPQPEGGVVVRHRHALLLHQPGTSWASNFDVELDVHPRFNKCS